MKKFICYLIIWMYFAPIKLFAQDVNGGSRYSTRDNPSNRLRTADDNLESRLKIDTKAYQERKNNGSPSSSNRSSNSYRVLDTAKQSIHFNNVEYYINLYKTYERF